MVIGIPIKKHLFNLKAFDKCYKGSLICSKTQVSESLLYECV